MPFTATVYIIDKQMNVLKEKSFLKGLTTDLISLVLESLRKLILFSFMFS